MFRKLIKNKKAQNTAEYAILISLVVAGIIAMQTYAQRALQARVRDASLWLAEQSNGIGNTLQYEPYYLTTNYVVDRADSEIQLMDNEITLERTNSFRTRREGGYQESAYNAEEHAGGEEWL